MSTKHLLAISLLLPLMAMSAPAQAGPTISDESYWPNEARRTVAPPVGAHTDVNSAFAHYPATPRLKPATINGAGSAPHYQGGPKGR